MGEVIVKVRALQLAHMDLITGIISVSCNGEWFPETNWRDFPVRLLGTWINEIVSAFDQGASNIQLMFMDGPYYIDLTHIAGMTWGLQFCERRKNSICREPPVTIDLVELGKETIRAGREVIEYCRGAGWDTQDITFLKRIIDRARGCSSES
jgi:hypothetical protein